MTEQLHRYATALVLGCLLATGGTTRAQTPSGSAVSPQVDVMEQVRQLRELVNKQQEQINQLQGQPKSGAATITDDQRREILELIKEELKEQRLPDWVSSLKIAGDFRFRTEWTEKANTEANTIAGVAQNRERTRQRVRARLGFFEQVNDEVEVGIQFITGGGSNGGANPISGNQTIGGDGFPGFEKKPVWFDLAYARYHPTAVPGLNVYLGRISNPFLEVGNSQLLWDADLRFEGMAVKYSRELAEELTFFANAGGFWINENDFAGQADSALWAAQTYVTLALPHVTPGAFATGGVSYYAYTHLEGLPTGPQVPGVTTNNGTLPAFPGNTTSLFYNPAIAAAGYTGLYSGYNVVNPFFEIGADDPWRHKRLALFGDFAYNTAARNQVVSSPAAGGLPSVLDNNAFAWLIGVSYGALKKPGDWQIFYNYRQVGADAVVAAFCEGGGTDLYGSRLTVAYQVAKGWQMAMNYYYANVTRADLFRESPSAQRLQFDFLFSF